MREKLLFEVIRTILVELFKIWKEKHASDSMGISNSKRSFFYKLDNELESIWDRHG
jgi:hypothetical protein